MGSGVAIHLKGKPVDEVKVGSVRIPIYAAPVTVKARNPEVDGNGAGQEQFKTYESFIISYYEGATRVKRRRRTPELARELAKEVATRLNRDGARAEYLSEKDRRIYVLAKLACKPLNLEVDEVCRRYAELQRRLKEGTPEQAVDFKNDHGQQIRHGATSNDVYQEYLLDLNKRGVGDYYLRDVKRYVDGFVEALPGVFSRTQTTEIDAFLGALGGKSRNKNNHRDAIISFYKFAQEKGFLPHGTRHAAAATTEFCDPRQKITTEAEALALLQPNDIYTPEEGRKLLAVRDEPTLKPTIEIKMLSGVRTEEIVRLWWVMAAEPEELIRVPDAVGKIDARRVPILPGLARRLKAIAATVKHGRVAAKWKTANSLYHAWQRLCKKAGVPYRRNAFRNSYFTYRLVLLGDIGKVAEEGGTSIDMLKKNYLSRAPVSRAQAEEWFSL
jgi:integrase